MKRWQRIAGGLALTGTAALTAVNVVGGPAEAKDKLAGIAMQGVYLHRMVQHPASFLRPDTAHPSFSPNDNHVVFGRATAGVSDTVTACTWNVYANKFGDQVTKRLAEVRDRYPSLDLIALQEVPAYPGPFWEHDVFDGFRGVYSPDTYWPVDPERPFDGNANTVGNALLARFPFTDEDVTILDVGDADLQSRRRNKVRRQNAILLEYDGITFGTSHFAFHGTPVGRMYQASTLLQNVSGPAVLPMDANLFYRGFEPALWQFDVHGFTDATPEAHGPYFADYIFSRGVAVQESDVLTGLEFGHPIICASFGK